MGLSCVEHDDANATPPPSQHLVPALSARSRGHVPYTCTFRGLARHPAPDRTFPLAVSSCRGRERALGCCCVGIGRWRVD